MIRFITNPRVQGQRLAEMLIDSCRNKDSIFFKLKYIVLNNMLVKKYNVSIGKTAIIGKGIMLPHCQNIVIGEEVVIGNNCTIYHDVTIGQNRGKYPIIGNNVIVYPGAKVFGEIVIEDGSIIGANSVVNKNVNKNEMVAGIPAKVVGIRVECDELS